MYVRVVEQTDFCVLVKENENNNYYVIQNYSFNKDGFDFKMNSDQTYYVSPMSYGMDVWIDGRVASTKPILLKTDTLEKAVKKLHSIHSFVSL